MMRMTVAIALVVSGCVSTELETNSKHPASPNAPTAPVSRSEAALTPGYDPFAGSETAPARAHEHEHGQWTCPMHPEIHRAEPGNCPICGMKLVPEKK